MAETDLTIKVFSELQEIKSAIKKGPDGMEKFAVNVEHLTKKVDEGVAITKGLESKLYEPTTGIYARLQSLEIEQKNHVIDDTADHQKHYDFLKENNERSKRESIEFKKELETLETNVVNIQKSVSKIEENNTEDTKKIIVKIKEIGGGEGLIELETIIKFKKNFDKLFWLLLTGVITTLGKFIFDLINSHNR